MSLSISRRSAIKSLAGSTAAVTLCSCVPESVEAAPDQASIKLKGNIHHSVSAWCYGGLFNAEKNKPAQMTFDTFCHEVAGMGIESVELLGPKEWDAVKKAGLTCAMCNGPDSIPYGWNRVEHHEDLLTKFAAAIPEVARAGFPNIITFSGNRNRMSDGEGLENCVKGLKRLAAIAEKNNVTVILELLNSKVDHKDYMADHTSWGVEVCKQVGSERLKLLYDIYHMQIMEGDVIRTIRENYACIGHYHTGGNPGRNEIDDTQELNYPAIMRAIAATGYKGFVGQEFVPRRDPLTSLRSAIQVCDV